MTQPCNSRNEILRRLSGLANPFDGYADAIDSVQYPSSAVLNNDDIVPIVQTDHDGRAGHRRYPSSSQLWDAPAVGLLVRVCRTNVSSQSAVGSAGRQCRGGVRSQCTTKHRVHAVAAQSEEFNCLQEGGGDFGPHVRDAGLTRWQYLSGQHSHFNMVCLRSRSLLESSGRCQH